VQVGLNGFVKNTLSQSVHSDLPLQRVAMGREPRIDRWFESDEDIFFIRKAMKLESSSN
jgi:hypothetical protein